MNRNTIIEASKNYALFHDQPFSKIIPEIENASEKWPQNPS